MKKPYFIFIFNYNATQECVFVCVLFDTVTLNLSCSAKKKKNLTGDLQRSSLLSDL